MSESELGREPAELLELIVPKCANKFGAAPCRAGWGSIGYEQDYSQGAGSAFVTGTASFVPVAGGYQYTATATFDRIIDRTSSFAGSDFRYIVLTYTPLVIPNQRLFLRFRINGVVADYTDEMTNLPNQEFFGQDAFDPGAGIRTSMVIDVADHADYATAWLGNTITSVDVGLGTGVGTSFIIHSIAVVANDPRDARPTACFNTRATCQDTDNFQARPAAHLTPDIVGTQGETGSHSFGSIAGVHVVAVDLTIPRDPSGVVFEIGGSTRPGYIGFTSGDLVSRCGIDDSRTARLTVDPTSLEGKQGTLIAVWVANGVDPATSELYFYDTLELELTLLGSATAAAITDVAFNTDDYGIGTVGGVGPNTGVATEDTSDFNGTITALRFYGLQSATLTPDADAYRFKYYFDDGRKAKPSDDLYIMPALSSAQSVPTRINVSSSDPRYEPIGRRASVSASVADFPHSDFPFDQYLSDRTYNPLERTTFWTKFVKRHKFGKTRALTRIYSGYDGDALSAMRSRTYFLDKIDFDGTNSARLSMRDYLALTEFSKAQVPEPSAGKLDAAIDASQTSIDLTGDVTAEYPASGTIRIDEEIMTYTGRTYDSSPDTTTFTGITRGTDGSTADSHDIDEGVQLCRRYTAARIDTVLEGLFVDDALLPRQLVDVAQFTSEYDSTLSAYTLTSLITEPTSVSRLIGEISLQCAFYLWWNERDQKVTMQAIKPLTGVAATFTQEDNIIADSFSVVEKPKERITTISFFYNPRDWAKDLDKPVNYKNQLTVSNSSNQDLDQYADLPERREVLSRWLTTQAQANQTSSRIAVRYEDVPQEVTFMVDAKDRQYWVGDFVGISHDAIATAAGARDSGRRWLIIEAEEVEAGHKQRLTCADVTLDGQIYSITENGIGTYTADLFGQGNAFITDSNGLNTDGSTGATIG